MSKRPTALAPEADRPYMPGYQTMFRKGAKSLSWASASKKLSKAHNYWLSTIGPNRKPHTMPVWGVWLDQAFYFSTGPRSRKARNIEKNPNCVICPENAEIAIILEGQARKASPNPLLRRVVKNYERKYNWKMQGSEDSFYRVQPMKAFGIVESGASNPTRWSFPRT